jgi:hypothetical protein
MATSSTRDCCKSHYWAASVTQGLIYTASSSFYFFFLLWHGAGACPWAHRSANSTCMHMSCNVALNRDTKSIMCAGGQALAD